MVSTGTPSEGINGTKNMGIIEDSCVWETFGGIELKYNDNVGHPGLYKLE